MLSNKTNKFLLTLLLLPMTLLQSALAADQIEPIDYLIKFDITGTFSGVTPQGAPVFTIGGPGYSTINTSTGEVMDSKIPGLQRASLSNAEITFVQQQPSDPAYVSRFTCLTANGGCRIELPDGSVLVADPEIALDGRLIGGMTPDGKPSPWGFIPNDKFDPQQGIFPQRILGCGGLRGIEGPLAGTVGAVCFNGTFNIPIGSNGIDVNRPLTGGSNCTISMHHPAYPVQ